MIIQFILTLGLGLCLLIGLAEQRRSPVLTPPLAILVATGLYFVWIPEHATVAARWFGVGRGADLLLYCWILISLVVALTIFLKLRRHDILVTELTRAIALQRPLRPFQPEPPALDSRDRPGLQPDSGDPVRHGLE